MNNLVKLEIPKGWTAFYDPKTKKVLGLSEFKNGGKAETSLTLISKTTKDELLGEFTTLNLTYIEPTK
jgi:hypothetical protein